MNRYAFNVPVGENGSVNVDIFAESEEDAWKKIKAGDFKYCSPAYKLNEATRTYSKVYGGTLTEQQKKEAINN